MILPLATLLAALAGGCDHPARIEASSDPSRIIPIHKLAIVARVGPVTASNPTIQDRLPTLLRACGIDTAVDVYRIVPALSSSQVEPPANVQADAVLVLDLINNPAVTGQAPRYGLRLRKPAGETIWRATAELDPSTFGIAKTDSGTAMAAALMNRMVADGILPGRCRQGAT